MSRKLPIAILVGTAVLIASAQLGGVSAQRRTDARPLSLAECLTTALENNLDLVSARLDPEISAEGVTGELAGFDPSANATFFANGFETEPSDEFTSAGIGKTYGARGQLLQDFKFGGNIDVKLTSSRRTGAGAPFFVVTGLVDGAGNPILDPATGQQVTANILDEPFYSTTLDATFTMPLLRNRGKEPNTELLQLAAGNLEISREELRRQAEVTIELVEGAYWDLLASMRALEVSRQSLKRSKDLLELNRKKVEVGTLAPIEITQAEAGVASNEGSVIQAEETLDNAVDALREFLAVPWGDPLWETPIVPTERPEFAPQKIDVDKAIAIALERRPEMANAHQDLRNKELSERAAKNRARHGLDLSANLAPIGNSFLIDSTDFVGNVGDTYEELFEGDFFNWTISLTYSVPIGNRAAKSNYRVASLNREKSEVGLAKQSQTIKVGVRAAARAIESGAKRVAAEQENVRLQREKLNAEQKKFENGMSTSFEVLTFQNDLASAELTLIQTMLDYTKARTAFERAKGTLLEARGLSLTP